MLTGLGRKNWRGGLFNFLPLFYNCFRNIIYGFNNKSDSIEINFDAELIKDIAVNCLTPYTSTIELYFSINFLTKISKSPSPDASIMISDSSAYSKISTVIPTSQSPFAEPSIL